MRPHLHLGSLRPPRRLGRRVIATPVVAAAITGGLSPLPANSARGAEHPVFPWPQCTPLCAHAPARGPRVTAIYVATHKTRGGPAVTIDAFVVRIPGRSVTGQLCYEAHHDPHEPGCIVTATTHGRRVGAGVWWSRFRIPVYERYQISNSNSHAVVRSYWFGVSVPVGATSVQGSRRGIFRFARP